MQEIITLFIFIVFSSNQSARGLTPRSIWQGFFSSFYRPGEIFKTVTKMVMGKDRLSAGGTLLITIQAPGLLFVF